MFEAYKQSPPSEDRIQPAAVVAACVHKAHRESKARKNWSWEQLPWRNLLPKMKSQQKNKFSIFSQGSLAVIGSKLSTNCNHVSQKRTAILHTGMTILELVIFKNQTSASTAEFNLFYLWLSQFPKQLGCDCTGRHRQSLISLPTQQ